MILGKASELKKRGGVVEVDDAMINSASFELDEQFMLIDDIVWEAWADGIFLRLIKTWLITELGQSFKWATFIPLLSWQKVPNQVSLQTW